MSGDVLRMVAVTNTISIICAGAVIASAGLVLYMLIQSIIQMIVGLCLGYTITSFSFAGFMFVYDGQKLRFTLAPARLFAETQMTRKTITGKIRVMFETVVILGMSIITAISVVIVNNVVDENIYIRILLIALLGFLLLNWLVYFSFLKQALGKGTEHDFWEYDLIFTNKIKTGGRPRDIAPITINENQKSVFAKKCMLLNYFHYLDAKEYDKLGPYITTFRDIIGDVYNVLASDMLYAYEIIYYYSIIEPNLELAEHYYDLVEEVLKNDMDLNGRRVYAGYLFGTNKSKQSVLDVIHQGLYSENRNSDLVIRGMEIELLSELKEKAYTKEN